MSRDGRGPELEFSTFPRIAPRPDASRRDARERSALLVRYLALGDPSRNRLGVSMARSLAQARDDSLGTLATGHPLTETGVARRSLARYLESRISRPSN